MSPREWINDVGNGPFIGVMVFILALTAAAVLFAQCCVGDRGFMRTGYDFEGYVIRKCAVCVGTGIPKRTHPHVQETGPLEVEVQVVEEVRASEPPTPAPVATAARAAPPTATAAEVAVAVPAAAKEEEEDEDDEDWIEDDDDEDEFLFEEEEDPLDL